MNPDVSIIIVNRNNRDLALRCLDHVHSETTRLKFELIVADNNSTDGSASAIRRQSPDATLLTSDENLGFARAANRAAGHARGRYLLFLSPRAHVLDSAIDRIVSVATCTPTAGIWTGRLRNPDGTTDTTNCKARATPWTALCEAAGLVGLFPNSALFNGEALGGWRRDTVRHVDIVSSTFLLIDAGLWRKLDGFDASFFKYGEDVDLCLRAGKLGAMPLFTPFAEARLEAAVESNNPAADVVTRYTAKATLIRKYWPLGTRWLGRMFLQSQVAARWLIAIPLDLARARSQSAPVAPLWRHVFATRKSWRQGYHTRSAPRTWAISAPADQLAATRQLSTG